MQEIYKTTTLDDTFFNDIVINDSWNFADQPENKMHRIHAYPAKFPSFITRKAITDIETEQNRSITTVGDVFCGCGTTAYEAMLKNKDFWGCDINPIAVLIAKTKSNTYKEDKLSMYFKKIQQGYEAEKDNITDDIINPRILYWFTHDQIKDLEALKKSINSNIPHKSKYYSFFRVAFSNILKHTSRWLQKSIKPTVDPNKPLINVWGAFEKQFLMMQRATKESTNKKSKINISKKSVLKIRTKSKVDLLVSSPPYVTSYEYADLHQMSALWLDYTEDYKKLRKGTIGSVYDTINYEKDKAQLVSSGIKMVNKLLEVDKKRAKNTTKYFIDMQKSMKKCYALLNQEGHALFVIGNTEYKGVRINNAQHLIESMFQVGFRKIFITKRKISNKFLTPYRTASGKFATASTANRKIYAEEFLVKAHK